LNLKRPFAVLINIADLSKAINPWELTVNSGATNSALSKAKKERREFCLISLV